MKVVCVRGRRAAVFLAAIVCAAFAAASVAADDTPPTVILVSWDGLRHDYPALNSETVPLPALTRIADQGVRARRLTPVFPSNTFPGHVSLATGTYPDRHGIPDNVFLDREKGVYRYDADANWLEAEPLWIAAARQGVAAATYFWVGSETDWHGQSWRYRVAPFDRDRLESAKVDQILAWTRLPPAERPRLIMSYWSGADHAGHEHGPDSDEVRAALVAQDQQMRRLLDGLDADDAWKHTTLILVSDHGMTELGGFLDLEEALVDAGVRARVFGATVAHVFLDDAAQIERAETAAVALGHVHVYRADALPADMRLRHPRRTGDLVVIADMPYALSRPAGLDGYLMAGLQLFGHPFGMHGYDPAEPDMGGVFMAMGRGVDEDLELGEVRQVDVAATVARLLGIEPPLQSEGRPVTGIGAP
jgi:hypothetical protein